jgi:MFS family permease
VTYRHTLHASYLGYVTQAIVNNLPPLLFIVFSRDFGISLERIGLLISLNFGVQIATDLACAHYIDKIGYRVSSVLAHALAASGLVLMGILPRVMEPYAGLIIATAINAVGGGMIEVLISPIVESLPGDEKAASMSLLHSFYCWGQMAVVLLSTAYFAIFGLVNWGFLTAIWAAVPLFNAFFFARVPLRPLVEGGQGMNFRALFSRRVFWLMLLMMVCAGASEQAMAQWSSLFAELGLGVTKTVGDLMGPCLFAILMGSARLFFGSRGARLPLEGVLAGSAALCVASYLLAVFSPHPLMSLAGCALCGLSVGSMWPATLSLSSRSFPQGGTAMFALLALAGDLGCSSGPGLVGLVSSRAQAGWRWAEGLFAGGTQAALKTGLLFAIAFPLLMALTVALVQAAKNKGEIS